MMEKKIKDVKVEQCRDMIQKMKFEKVIERSSRELDEVLQDVRDVMNHDHNKFLMLIGRT